MPKRRRYATRNELAALLAERMEADEATRTTIGAVVDELGELGVAVDNLVKIEVVETV